MCEKCDIKLAAAYTIIMTHIAETMKVVCHDNATASELTHRLAVSMVATHMVNNEKENAQEALNSIVVDAKLAIIQHLERLENPAIYDTDVFMAQFSKGAKPPQ